MKAYINKLTFIFLAIAVTAGCQKRLDINPNQRNLIPTSIDDMQAILDGAAINTSYPYGMEASADDYYLSNASFNALTNTRDLYIWSQDLYRGTADVQDWSNPYKCIFSSNVVIQVLQNKRDGTSSDQYRTVYGHGLFVRASYYHALVLQFCKQFDAGTVVQDPGLPLKTDPSIADIPKRSTLKETYDFIVNDLNKAIELLPKESIYKTRPTKAAALALLARVYLSMNDYEKALLYANAAVEIKSDILDYNMLKPTDAFPIKQYNNEVVYDGTAVGTPIFSDNNYYVDSILYKLYQPSDLRKTCFFKLSNGNAFFKGNYTGFTALFQGITVSEVYLMRSECRARKGDIEGAMSDLNKLLENRYEKASFMPATAQNNEDALKLILQERRKELIFRGLRWMDLKRLNKDARFKHTITRFINGRSYELLPNDPRYVHPIPDSEVQFAGLTQNER